MHVAAALTQPPAHLGCAGPAVVHRRCVGSRIVRYALRRLMPQLLIAPPPWSSGCASGRAHKRCTGHAPQQRLREEPRIAIRAAVDVRVNLLYLQPPAAVRARKPLLCVSEREWAERERSAPWLETPP